MASLNNIKISLEDDAYEVFKATRVIHCQASGCTHHSISFDRFGSHAECTLNRIYITKTGSCEQYEAKDDETN